MINITDNQFGFKYREIATCFTMEKQMLQINTMTHNAIFFLLEGEFLISFGNYRNVHIKAGELYFLPRGANVSACVVGSYVKYIAVRMEHDIDNSSIINEILKGEYCEGESFRSLPIVKPLDTFLESVRYYIVNGMDCLRMQNIKINELYILLYDCYSKEDLASMFHVIHNGGSKFRTYILDNYKVSVSIDELAEKANMSRSTFDRTFKENFGMTPHKWIDIQTRILIQRKASEPNVTVKDMMYEVGVYNSSQFTKLCKRLFGMPPSRLI
ncbi:MAG: AraC family transcriptional regulator [Rikenellaceae bacterium]